MFWGIIGREVFKMKKSYEEYRQEIYFLDEQIKNATDPKEKAEFIDKNIALNKEYIQVLRKPLAARKFWCIFLSIVFFGMGLFIFLPSIIIRNNKASACERIVRLNAMRAAIK